MDENEEIEYTEEKEPDVPDDFDDEDLYDPEVDEDESMSDNDF